MIDLQSDTDTIEYLYCVALKAQTWKIGYISEVTAISCLSIMIIHYILCTSSAGQRNQNCTNSMTKGSYFEHHLRILRGTDIRNIIGRNISGQIKHDIVQKRSN